MAAVPSELVVLIVMACIAVPAATFGSATDAPAAVADPPSVPAERETSPEVPETPDPELRTFKGAIIVADPSGEAFGADGALWAQSCARFEFEPEGHTNATLNLTDGASDGEVEDLDLWFWDADGDLLDKATGRSKGIGTHHEALVPERTAAFSVCLVDGAQAKFLVSMV